MKPLPTFRDDFDVTQFISRASQLFVSWAEESRDKALTWQDSQAFKDAEELAGDIRVGVFNLRRFSERRSGPSFVRNEKND